MKQKYKHTYIRDELGYITNKSCKVCHYIQPIIEFYEIRSGVWDCTCRSCWRDIRQTKSGHKPTIRLYNDNKEVVAKECKKCAIVKPIDNFYFKKKTRNTPDGRTYLCMDCHKAVWHAHAQVPEARTRWLLMRLRSKSKKLNLPFDLTIDDLVIPSHCPILGMPLAFGMKKISEYRNKKQGVPMDSPSVDRIIPELGYVKDNIVIVSYRANLIKTNASVDELTKVADFYKMLVSNNCKKKAV